jgi:K+-transporting ATPase KdpF subunit
LVAGLIDSGPDWFGPNVRVYLRVRQGLREFIMILFAAIVTVLLFIYLLTALLRPEWF